MKIVNFGSLNVDHVYRVPHTVLEGETISSTGKSEFCGGKGLNQSIAMARAGLDVYLAGAIGTDGDMLLKALHSDGIKTEFIQVLDYPGGHTVIQVNEEGQNSIIVYSGTNKMLDESYIERVISSFDQGDILVLQNEINMVGDILRKAKESGLVTVFNHSPCDADFDSESLEYVNIIVINEIEGHFITGEEDEDAIISNLSKRYPDMKIVLTLGKKGAVYYDTGKVYKQKAFNADVKAVDTTGAGDTFLGYFVYGFAKGKHAEDILELASKAAAISVSREGAAVSIPGINEVLAFQEQAGSA